MLINSELPEQRLRALGIELPNVPVPVANFIPWRRSENFVYLSGQVCEWNGEVVYKGKVGSVHALDAAKDAARICMLNLIAALRSCLNGDLNSVESCIRVGGFVNCVPDFESVPQVINGASDLLHQIFGPDCGAHVRTAVGVAQLPQNAAVEVDAIFSVKS